MNTKRVLMAAVCATCVAVPMIGVAQKGPKDKAPTEITVGFGVLPPTTAIIPGDPDCLTAGIGGPTDPCAYRLHHLTPEESVLAKGGELTLQVNGGGHAPAIYKVSKDTTRFDLGQFLCPGDDPEHIDHPRDEPCNLVLGTGAANAAKEHIIKDGDGDVVIVAAPAGAPPLNLVWSPPGRLQSTRVGNAFVANDTKITYRFLKTGRYLIICMNRSHFLNDWMFGFVNVVGDGDDSH
jgi:hypothetical protein